MDHPGPQNDNKKLLKTIMSKSLQLCTDLSSFSICSFMFLFFVNTTLHANLFSSNSSGNNNHNLINQSWSGRHKFPMVKFNLKFKPFKTDISKRFSRESNF